MCSASSVGPDQVNSFCISAPSRLPIWLQLTHPGLGMSWGRLPQDTTFSPTVCSFFWQRKCCVERSIAILDTASFKALCVCCSCYSLLAQMNFVFPCNVFHLEWSLREKNFVATDAFECFHHQRMKLMSKASILPTWGQIEAQVTNQFFSLRCLLIHTLPATFMVLLPFLVLIIIVTTVFSLEAS